jgi:hypothetical protein
MHEMAVDSEDAENYLMHSAERYIITRRFRVLKQQNERRYDEVERHTYV